MKRTREITIIHYRRRTVKKRRAANTGDCPVCGSGVNLITVAMAARLTGVSRSVLTGWIAGHQVHATQSTTGQPLICLNSLIDSELQAEDGAEAGAG
jgi:hypothetical protein